MKISGSAAWIAAAISLALWTGGCGGGGREAGEQRGVETAAPPPAAAEAAAGTEMPVHRNWALLEFAEPVTAADLAWLEANGFRVDTVMGEKLVRGWLADPAGAEVLSKDGRIARIKAQQR